MQRNQNHNLKTVGTDDHWKKRKLNFNKFTYLLFTERNNPNIHVNKELLCKIDSRSLLF